MIDTVRRHGVAVLRTVSLFKASRAYCLAMAKFSRCSGVMK
jgi:hypothetical protein